MLFLLRMLAIGVNFLFAGIVGLLICLSRPFNPDNSRLCARLYSIPTLWLLRWRLHSAIDSLTQQQRACIIICNHQSNYDLYVLGRIVPPRTVSVGKKSLKWLPFFGQQYWLAGNMLLDRSNPMRSRKALHATTDALKNRDTSIWIFPEGTRNHGKGLLPFKKGAFQMALAAGVPIIPVCVSSYPRHIDVKRWRGSEIRLRSLAPIATTGLTHQDLPQLMKDCREQMQACIDELDRQINPTA